MSRIVVVVSAALLLCASSQFALADQNGLVTGAVGFRFHAANRDGDQTALIFGSANVGKLSGL